MSSKLSLFATNPILASYWSTLNASNVNLSLISSNASSRLPWCHHLALYCHTFSSPPSYTLPSFILTSFPCPTCYRASLRLFVWLVAFCRRVQEKGKWNVLLSIVACCSSRGKRNKASCCHPSSRGAVLGREMKALLFVRRVLLVFCRRVFCHRPSSRCLGKKK